MKPFSLPLVLCLVTALPAAAATYECTDSQGRRTYTATAGANCKAVDLGRPATYTSVRPAPASAQSSASGMVESEGSVPAEPAAAAPSAAAVRAAEERLNQAKRDLEEGRKVRYGNERNYARYLERIKGLEDAVAAAQKELNSLQGR